MPSPLPRDEGLLFANRSGRSDTDLGIDRRAPKVLEVAEIWSDFVVDVQHFSHKASVTLGDRDRPTSRFLSGTLVAALVLGIGGLMLGQARLEAPPLLPAGDADCMEAWEATRAAARLEATRLAGEADEMEEEMEPQVELPSDLLGSPNWETTLREALLPEAERLAATGDLPGSWAAALRVVPAEYDLFDDLHEQRVLSDLPLGTRVVLDDRVWTVISGELGRRQALVEDAPVALARAGSRDRSVAGSTGVRLWAPTPEEGAALTALHHRIASVLMLQADAAGSARARCAAADGLVVYEDRFTLHALRARCLADQGDWTAVAEAVDRARSLDPGEPREPIGALTAARHRELTLGLLDADARSTLVAAFPGEETAEAAAMDEAERSHNALRDFVLETAHDAAILRSADDGLHRIGKHRLQEKQDVFVQRAVWLGASILLLLPLGWRLDERRATRRGANFHVDSAALPSHPFPLVADGEVGVPSDVPCTVLWDDGEKTGEELVAEGRMVEVNGVRRISLRDGERLIARFGNTRFLVHHVPAARAVAGARAATFDSTYLSILAALLFIGASFGVHLMTGDYAVTHQFVQEVETVGLLLTPPEEEKELEVPTARTITDEPNPGDKPKADAGKVGDPKERLKKARGARTAVDRAERDRSEAEKAGILSVLDMEFARNDLFGGGGELDRATANLGSHVGEYGRQIGSRGFGPGGPGDGGGGGAETLGGWDTLGTPGGRRLGEPGRWKRTKSTKGPIGDDTGVVVGGMDKSIIDRIVKQHLAQFRFCYEKELQGSPDLHGKVVMKWVIDKSGSVSSASVKRSSLDNPIVEACMVTRVRRLRFPAPRGGGIVLVSYPFVFNAR